MVLRRRLVGGALAALLLGILSCSDTTGPPADLDLLDRLNALPGVSAREIPPQYGYPRAFQLDITQPLDHRAPFGRTFTQRAYLSHTDESMPLVFGTSGYGANEYTGSELAALLQTNGLYVVHRFFPDARPSPMDWRYLNIRQAASDHHRIVQIFREIYPGPWVSTGASKGGMTALFHRRFFPDDVEATVAYVAPMMFSLEDERFVPFLAGLSTPEGRDAIHDFQQRLLTHSDSLLSRFEAWFPANGQTLNIPAGPAFESRVRGYEWNFWQRHIYDYSQIPGPDEPYDRWIEHMAVVVRLHFTSDVNRDYFSAYQYQALTELGGPAMDLSHLDGLYRFEPMDTREKYDLPEEIPEFSSEVTEDVVQWLETQGDGIIYIYGGVDPWTGGAVQPSPQTNALKFVQPGADHSVGIQDLDQRDLVLSTLGEWMGIQVAPVTSRSITMHGLRAQLGIR